MGNCCCKGFGLGINLNLNLDEECRHICCPERDAVLLRDEIDALISSKKDMEGKTSVLERDPRKKVLCEVKSWIDSVNKHQEKVNGIIDPDGLFLRNENRDGLCCCFCSNHSLGVEVKNELQIVRRLKAEKDSWGDKLTRDVPLEYVGPNADGIVGIEERITEVVDYLRKDGVAVIGIYGMGGVGKTTLINQVTRRLRSSSDTTLYPKFNSIISVVVSRNPDIRKIQNEIAKQIGISELGDDQRERANVLSMSLSTIQFLLVLDDVWGYLDLGTLGIPLHQISSSSSSSTSSSRSSTSSSRSSSRVVLTTRYEYVCGAMGAQKSRVEARCLGEEDAWKLFQTTVKRDDTWFESQRGTLRKIAEEMVHRCGGLPLLLITVARAMATKQTKQEWEDAKNSLKESAKTEIRDMENVYESLKFSFDNLRNDECRSCLLYSALFPEDHVIYREDMVDYFIAGGSIYGGSSGESGSSVDIERLRRRGRTTISDLIDACLLERVLEDENFVKVHDAVRDMIIWLGEDEPNTSRSRISSGGRGKRIQIRSLAGKGEEGDFEVDEILGPHVSMASLHSNRIKRVVVSDAAQDDGRSNNSIQVLLLNYNEHLETLSERMFQYFPTLRVLDLRGNEALKEIPASIASLKSLRYLNMKRTLIKSLPREMSKLTKLMQLDLSQTDNLSDIPTGVFSSFTKLQSLHLIDNAFFSYISAENVHVLKELDGLTGLKTVHLSFKGDPIGVGFLLDSEVLSKSTTHLVVERVNLTEDGMFRRIGLGCKKLELLNIRNSSLKEEQPELTIEKDHFSRLKYLEIWNPHWKLPSTITIRGCESLVKLAIRPVTTNVKVAIRCEKRWWEGLDWHGLGGRQPSYVTPIFDDDDDD